MIKGLLAPVAMYHRDFVELGGVNVAIYLSNLLWNAERWQNANGWMDAHICDIQKITGLSPHEQMVARIALRGQSILEDTKSGRLDPIIRINMDVLARTIGGDA